MACGHRRRVLFSPGEAGYIYTDTGKLDGGDETRCIYNMNYISIYILTIGDIHDYIYTF